ncbi:hypothetical protein BpHYR1_012098 [Brachionus plicatilis]|uniref:Uncharacterized protein n=1 Tax=Brachionus plicatilis TaxID=10195 RepID=A0A3M7R435_BRAPC|nr:hypothetical protein BpHYR1_012098 [Brachionus plicatilis]
MSIRIKINFRKFKARRTKRVFFKHLEKIISFENSKPDAFVDLGSIIFNNKFPIWFSIKIQSQMLLVFFLIFLIKSKFGLVFTEILDTEIFTDILLNSKQIALTKSYSHLDFEKQ